MSDIVPASRVRGSKPYKRTASTRSIDLRLDANEGGTFASNVLGSIHADSELICRYPNAQPLEAKLAARLNVEPERVLVTAGADDALYRACNAMLEPGRTAAYCVPTFEMLSRYVKSNGADAIEIDWLTPKFPADELIAAANTRSATVVFIVSPNNPTGTVATRDQIAQVREHLPQAVLVLDAAYAEFSDPAVADFATNLPWTIVTRTFSKAWGAAGLRVGYAAGDRRVIDWLRTVGQPYACSAISLACAEILLDAGERASRSYLQSVRAEREALFHLLAELGARPIESEANFVFARFDDAPGVADQLADRGIAVRRFDPASRLADALRIGCPGDANSFKRLTLAIREIRGGGMG